MINLVSGKLMEINYENHLYLNPRRRPQGWPKRVAIRCISKINFSIIVSTFGAIIVYMLLLLLICW